MALADRLKASPRLFSYRIPLTFYPLIMLCVIGLFLKPSLSLQELTALEKAVLTAMYAAGFALRLWASSILTDTIVLHADAQSNTLVTSGPFSQIRHPLYAGAGLMFMAMAIFWPAIIVLPFLIYEGLIAIKLSLFEEDLMEANFGDKYRDYKKSTGRYVPKIFIHEHDERKLFVAANLLSGIRSEFIFALYGVFFVLGLWTGKDNLFFAGVLVSTGVAAIVVRKFLKDVRI